MTENTKTDGISSGLVVVGVFADVNKLNGKKPQWEHMIDSSYDGEDYIYLVRLSDAEAIISHQAERIKELEAKNETP